MRFALVINLVLFQLVWFGCVIGAAHDQLLPGVLALGLLLLWQSLPRNRADGDLKLLIIAAVLGTLLDTLWIQFNFLHFRLPLPHAQIAPAWIVMLWIGFALTLNHSLAWLKRRYIIATVFAGIAGPLSYFAGERLGALHFQTELWRAITALSISWAIAFPLLLRIAEHWSAEQEPQP